MKKLVILRGPSGTGKTTISSAILMRAGQEHANGAKLCTLTHSFHETDQFFTDEKGVYHFTMAKLKNAHKWNQLQVERSMLHGTELVIVANTFIAHWEMEAYFELAEEFKYEVDIVRTPGPWDAAVLFGRNKHSVPLDVIKRHISGYQPHEKDVEWTDLSIFQS